MRSNKMIHKLDQSTIAIQQHELPHYRVPFLKELTKAWAGGVDLFTGAEVNPTLESLSSTCPKFQRHEGQNHEIGIGSGSLRFVWQSGLLGWLRTRQPDVLVLAANPRLITNYAAARYMKAKRRPTIGWGLGALDRHGHDALGWLRPMVLKRFCNSFDAMIAYSHKAARDYVHLGVPKDRVFVAPNSVANGTDKQIESETCGEAEVTDQWKRAHGLGGKPIVFFVGRIQRRKRIDDLIRACAPIADRCHLMLVGDGPDRPRLEEFAKTILPETVFMGHQSGEELARCFSAGDLFVMPGLGGLALHEAMAHGKAVICTSGDGTEVDLVRNGQNGFRVHTGDITSLTNQIEAAVKNPNRLLDMGRASQQVVAHEHNMRQMVDGFLAAVTYALERHSLK